MPIKSVKMKISKNKKMHFFFMSQGSLDPKIRFLGQKMFSVACVQTDTQTQKWLQRTPFQGFRIFFFNLSSRIGPKNSLGEKLWRVAWKLITKSNTTVLCFFCTVHKQIATQTIRQKSDYIWQTFQTLCVCVFGKNQPYPFVDEVWHYKVYVLLD